MTREKAIKIIKEFINGTCLHLVDQEALETLIPELAESEDEKIRKDIINLIYWLKDNPRLCSQYYIDRYDGMLAWLEKQKEQKPAEWSEEDEVMLKGCIRSIEEARDKRYPNECDANISYNREINWLKSLKPQSQVECDTVKGIAWLEEHFFDNNHHSGRGDYGRIESDDFDSMEEMFASFRKEVCTSPQSHWKPSEEQMDALIYAMQVMNTDLSPIAARTYQGLQEIHQNLKKL